ncbi:MAG: galactose oxidase, partial [Hyphomonas sp. 34-62-18]
MVLADAAGAMHLMGGRSPSGQQNAAWTDQADQTHHFVLTGPDGRWQKAAPCLTARNSAAGAEIRGNLHVVGGRSVAGGNTARHEVYDLREDRWRKAAPMPQAQGGLAAAAVGGKLYAFGGEYFDNGGGVYPEAWMYDPAGDA